MLDSPPRTGYIINGREIVYPHRIDEYLFGDCGAGYTLYYNNIKEVKVDEFNTVQYVEEKSVPVFVGDIVEIIK